MGETHNLTHVNTFNGSRLREGCLHECRVERNYYEGL